MTGKETPEKLTEMWSGCQNAMGWKLEKVLSEAKSEGANWTMEAVYTNGYRASFLIPKKI